MPLRLVALLTSSVLRPLVSLITGCWSQGASINLLLHGGVYDSSLQVLDKGNERELDLRFFILNYIFFSAFGNTVGKDS